MFEVIKIWRDALFKIIKIKITTRAKIEYTNKKKKIFSKFCLKSHSLFPLGRHLFSPGLRVALGPACHGLLLHAVRAVVLLGAGVLGHVVQLHCGYRLWYPVLLWNCGFWEYFYFFTVNLHQELVGVLVVVGQHEVGQLSQLVGLAGVGGDQLLMLHMKAILSSFGLI